MSACFFFYDLETTGVSTSRDHIMQFAGQRTDLNLNHIGDSFNIRIRLTDDILPAPEAVLLSGLSPLTIQIEGITEAEFCELFNSQIVSPATIFTGFNNIRFDDEFLRYLNYRNFYDAYSWHWQGSSSRWDMLDVVRMTRALRPEGINWPFNEEGKPINKLEQLTLANKLTHSSAHDALSDALATIEVAKMLKMHQPKLFNYLLGLRSKTSLMEIVSANQALLYTSSHYSSDVLHTTAVYVISADQKTATALVYDLREDPSSFITLTAEELTDLWEYNPEAPKPRLPVKTMKLNRCPAIAPLTVLDEASIKRLNLNLKTIEVNRQLIAKHAVQFNLKLNQVIKNLDNKRQQRRAKEPYIPSVDERLYDKFIPKSDSSKFKKARELAKLPDNYTVDFEDKRLNELFKLYRARNFPEVLTTKEKANWREFVKNKVFTGDPSKYQVFQEEVAALSKLNKKDRDKLKLLNDLKNYGETILNDYGTD